MTEHNKQRIEAPVKIPSDFYSDTIKLTNY